MKSAICTCPDAPGESAETGPGHCPICGMALEPLLPLADEETSELEDMTRRFWVSAMLTLPLLVISMSDLVPGLNLHHRLGSRCSELVAGSAGHARRAVGRLAVLRARMGVVQELATSTCSA